MATESPLIFPEEVLGMVLKNMILEKPQLLNARLVSRSWNKAALDQLKKTKFMKTLNQNSIKKFIKFAQASPNPQIVIPFFLSFTISGIKPTEEEVCAELEGINSSLESLFNIFTPQQCVHTLYFNVSPKTVDQLSEVVKILVKVSPVVDTIKLYPFKLSENVTRDHVKELFQTHKLNFPKLKKLKLASLHLSRAPGPGIPGNIHKRLAQLSFCSHMIKASPVLEALYLPSDLKNNEIEISPEVLQRIKQLNVKDLLLIDLVGDSKLLTLPSVKILQIRASIHLPWQIDHPQYRRFLESLFPISHSLESLTIEFIGSRRPINLTPFPEFPSLKQLQIRSCWNVIPDFVNPVVFPILTSIEINLEIFGVLNKSNEIDDGIREIGQQVPSVKELTLRLRAAEVGPGQGLESFLGYLPLPVTNPHPFYGYFDKLCSTFPNAKKLTIINESFQEKSFKSFFRGLKGAESARNFYELEFEDFDENYLGQVFEETRHPPMIILENMPRNTELEKTILQIYQTLGVGLDVNPGIEIDENGKTIIQALPDQETPNQLINLKSLTLRLFRSTKFNCTEGRVKRLTALRCTSEEQKKLLAGIPNSLNLVSLARNLPSLEAIRISPIMFGYNETILANEIQTVRAEFPDIKIITI